jgi:aubergine-like protein
MNLEFIEQPFKVPAYKLDAGKMIMGADEKQKSISFDIECCGRDLDRKVQCQMFDQPKIERWGIFYQERDLPSCKEFIFNMEKTVQQFGYPAKAMASFAVKGHSIDMWKDLLRQKVNDKVDAVVLLLPGSKGRCVLYNEIKKFLLEEVPVISQVVLVGTIRAGKNVRSIVSKVLIQICAKIGGVPWKVDDMPLLDKPAMVCGLDVYHATHLGRKSVLGFCASFNNSATKYWSKSIIQDVGQEAAHHLQSLIEKSFKKFQKLTSFFPQRLIFYRDGLGDA